jgi:hypothetical protein
VQHANLRSGALAHMLAMYRHDTSKRHNG